jgi:hypothetical protein
MDFPADGCKIPELAAWIPYYWQTTRNEDALKLKLAIITICRFYLGQE